MGKAGGGREWMQIYAIYGVDDWHTPLFLFIHALAFSILSLLFLLYFDPICSLLHHRFLPGPATARFAAGFAGSVAALSAVCLFLSAAGLLYSAVPLHWEMSQRMVSLVPDWSAVRHALDLGGGRGRGILLNAVALQLKKSGSSGRVVGLIPGGGFGPARTLRTAGMEGVQEYVTCRAGDPSAVPFGDGSFDVVVSAAFVGGAAAGRVEERMRPVGEAVRVLRPGGVGVVWAMGQAAEDWARRLAELRMEEVRVSERVTAFMAATHIVSFRKPCQQSAGGGGEEVRLDWRFNALC